MGGSWCDFSNLVHYVDNHKHLLITIIYVQKHRNDTVSVRATVFLVLFSARFFIHRFTVWKKV